MELQFFMKLKFGVARVPCHTRPENIDMEESSCVSVTKGGTPLIILDGRFRHSAIGQVVTAEVKELHVCTDSLHIDHTMGLGFFQTHVQSKNSSNSGVLVRPRKPLLHRLRRYFFPSVISCENDELAQYPIIHEVGNSGLASGNFKLNLLTLSPGLR